MTAEQAQQVTATILGCGSSAGVPRVGNNWGQCDPQNAKNRRRRCSLLIEGRRAGCDRPTRIIIDTGCDLREQMLDHNVDAVDAVFYTHEHADHTHGIDDLRVLALINKKRIDVYMSSRAAKRITTAFDYCFETSGDHGYPPILTSHIIEAGDRVVVDGPGGSIEVLAFTQEHGGINSLGFRVGGFAYSVDLSGLPDDSLNAVANLDVWVLDALRPVPHPSHLCLPESLDWIERMKPSQAILTNLHIDMDYESVKTSIPSGVSPAFDGLVVDVTRGKVVAEA